MLELLRKLRRAAKRRLLGKKIRGVDVRNVTKTIVEFYTDEDGELKILRQVVKNWLSCR